MRFLAIALLLSACTRFATFHPATRPVEDRARAPDRAVAALVGMGYTVDTQSGGAVTSTWFEAKNDIGEVFMLRWAVTLTAWEGRRRSVRRRQATDPRLGCAGGRDREGYGGGVGRSARDLKTRGKRGVGVASYQPSCATSTVDPTRQTAPTTNDRPA